MKVFVPNYYKDFACIADKCKHSCCIGWKIDIDEDTYAYYKTVTGAIGVRLRENIATDGDAPNKKRHLPMANVFFLC